MYRRATILGRQVVLSVLVGTISLLTWSTIGWTATRLGNAELLMWYRQRHTFHTDGGEHFDWVQWRNELFGWLIYEYFIKEGKVFDTVELPLISQLVERGTLNARYR